VEIFATSLPRKGPVQHSHPVVGANECEVTIVQDGRRRSFTLGKNAEPILEAALGQGIELPYACKGGICATCRAKLVEGEVDMDSSFALEDYEVARGFVLTCQSYPVTDKVTLDFDQDT